MPLFITDEEFERCSNNVTLMAEKADSFIRNLQIQIETIKAQADASIITSEQTCSLLEQKYISLQTDFEILESQNQKLNSEINQRISDLAELNSEKHQLNLSLIGKDGEIERLSTEVSEIRKSQRQLLGLVEQKDIEINEKNATIKSYLDKIVNLTDAGALKQAELHDREAELARSHATCARLSQEKELIEKHNVWLNEELTAKVGEITEVRRTHAEAEAVLSIRLADFEKKYHDCSSSLKWNKERVRELEKNLTLLQEDLCSSKSTAAENEERSSAEISTVSKLVELYKESSEEWSRKAGELEGVIKALETHLTQVESDYKEKLQKEVAARILHEKEAADYKEKLDKSEAEIEKHRKANELSLLPINSFAEETWAYRMDADEVQENDRMVVPRIPVGVSGTALAASLLRDGWSLAKMYEKYQEAVDALRHETMGRKQSQAVLERVLYEIEQKAEIIMDERAEHERMAEAYSMMNQKLQQSTSEHAKSEGTIQELKADLRRSEREFEMAQKEIIDLQKQVTVLLKECRDIQLRCGSSGDFYGAESETFAMDTENLSDTERVIQERLLTFKDINELVDQNVKLRSLVRNLSDQNETRDSELREMFEMELRKQTDEAASKVSVVLQRAEEQGQMIEALHRSVAMYKRLYEEENKINASSARYSEAIPDSGRKDSMLLLEDSQDSSKKAHEQAVARIKNFEEELERSRKEAVSFRLERDKLLLELNFAREKLDSFMKEFEHQREEMNGVLARNVEFSQLIIEYQRKVRESSESVHVAEELSRKSTMEVSLLKHEKELALNSEKRACDEVRSLSERVHRLQATIDTIHSTEEVREEARTLEKKRQEEYLKQVERDWAQVKKELQEERDTVRSVTRDREHTLQNAMKQVEELGTQLADSLRAVASAESRAAVAEARCSNLEAILKDSRDKGVDGENGPTSLTNEVTMDLPKVKEEMEKLKEEARVNKDHMLQYKNIAHVNEVALKQVEAAHERFKIEADKMKKSLEAEILTLRGSVSELENDSKAKSIEFASAVAGKEEALDVALAEIDSLKSGSSVRGSQIMEMEVQISSLKEDLEKEHQRWRVAQNNYERQVILQSDTIQELTKTSQALGSLQEELSKLHKLSDTLKSENAILKETLASEKSVLGKLKDEAERKYNEVNEQNKILHNRLEALHIKIAERERHSAGTGSLTVESQGEHDLQSVVSYLRRSKEIAETEISLLKQEKLRLQSQLEGAMKASETAQSQLSTERANSRALLFSDEDFKSLQIQVREINLLRESNLQLREENKHNFEECQKLRELAQKTRVEMDQLEAILKERNIEVDSCRNEIERRKMEKLNLENRINELLGACKNIDVDEYNRMKDDCQQMQVKLKAIEAELNETKKLMLEKQDIITCLEQELSNTRVELAEREKTIKASLAAQEALQKDVKEKNRIGQIFKRKFEKEKEDSSKEKITLTQQLEEARQSKRQMVDVSVEQTLIKEKESRIQTLEKALEKRIEEVKKLKDEQGKEKLKRVRNEKTVEELWKKANDLCKKANEDKTQVLEKFEKCKKLKEAHPEGGASSHTSEIDNQVASYVQTLENLEEAVSAFGALTQAQASETPSAPAPQAVTQSLPSRTTSTAGLSQAKTSDQREKPASSLKPTPVESRKPRFVRPNLTAPRAQEPSGDTDMAEMDGGTNTESKKGLPAAPARKRLASSQGQESREDSQDMGSVQAVPPVSKKLKSEQAQESADVPPQVPLASKKAKTEQPEGSIERPPQSVVEVQPSDELSQEAATDNSTIADLEEDPKEPIVDANETPSTELLDASEEDEEQDPEQNAVETESDREEGELPSDMVDELDVPASPAVDEEIDEALETLDEKMETGEGVEETGEESDNDDDDDQIVADPEKSPRGAVGSDPTDPEKSPKNSGSSDPTDPEKSPKNSGSSDPTDPEKSPRGAGSSDPTDQVAPVVEVEAPVVELEDQPVERKTRRTINLSAKALENSEKRKKGIVESSSTTASTPSAPTPTEGGRATPLRRVARGVGRGVVRGRGTTPRGGRRQA